MPLSAGGGSAAQAAPVLLVEFINSDQFPGQINDFYPLIAGSLRHRGWPFSWIRFGITTDNLYRHGRDEVTLDAVEKETLRKEFERLDPRICVLTHQLDDQNAIFAGKDSSPSVILFADLVARQAVDPLLPGFFVSDYLADSGLTPEYRWLAGNREAMRSDRRNIYAALPEQCGYFRSVEGNPCYAGLTLAPADRSRGCAFCGNRPEAAVPDVAGGNGVIRDWITRQFESIAACHAGGPPPNAVMFKNLADPSLVGHARNELDRLGLQGARLLFGCRCDRLLAVLPELEEAVARLDGTPAAIHLFVMGLENFSAEELLRFNKGFGPSVAIRAVTRLQQLQADHPESFQFSGYRAFAMILFTPWTTPADLHLNLAVIRHLGIAHMIGNLYQSRLRLHDDLPITRLAERDQLLTDAETDGARVLNRRKLFPGEHPWRFADRRLEPVAGLALRLAGNPSLDGDRLYRTVQRRISASGIDRYDDEQLLRFFRSLVETAAFRRRPIPTGRLLEQAAARYLAADGPESRRPLDGGGLAAAVPGCCAGAWSRNRWSTLPAIAGWALLESRMAMPGRLADGEVPPADRRPLFVPCSAGCAADDGSQAARGEGGAASAVRVLVFPLEGDPTGRSATIEVTGGDCRTIEYDPRTGVSGGGRLAARLRSGDRLEVAPGQLRIIKGGRLVDLLSVEAGIWDARDALDADFWSALSDAAFRRLDPRQAAACTRSHERALLHSADLALRKDTVVEPAPDGTGGGGDDGGKTRGSEGANVDWTEITITRRCNQRCFFCYEDGRDISRDLPFEEIRRLLAETARRSRQVVLCGREALLRPDILEIVDHARSLGLVVVVFTNGQALARPGLVDSLVEAGCSSLVVSFHFPDAATFARGARVSPRMFGRILEGLGRVRQHLSDHPSSPLSIATETDMFALNLGRLSDMRRTLCDALDGVVWQMRLACLLPTLTHDIGLGQVLEPLDLRRAELAAFIGSHPSDLPLKFVKTPLCLLPAGYEHRSLDVEYVREGTRLTFNHADREAITPDPWSISAEREILSRLARQPYRWLCRTCSLAPVCRFERCDWTMAGFEPTRQQRPMPFVAPGIGELLLRLGPDAGGIGRAETLAARIGATSFPEEELLASLAQVSGRQPRLVEAWVDREPVAVVAFRWRGRDPVLRLRAPGKAGPGGRRLGCIIDYLDTLPGPDDSGDRAALNACRLMIAGRHLPEPEAWSGDDWFDQQVARLFRTVWRMFGRRIWPGNGRIGGWSVADATLSADGTLHFELGHPKGGGAEIGFWLPASGDASSGLETAVAVSFSDGTGKPTAARHATRRRLLRAVAVAVLPPVVSIPVPDMTGAGRFELSDGGWQSGRTVGDGRSERLLVTVRTDGQTEPFRYSIGIGDASTPAFRRAGRLVLIHHGQAPTGQQALFAGALAAVMRTMAGKGPEMDSVDLWRAALAGVLKRAGIQNQFEWSIERSGGNA